MRISRTRGSMAIDTRDRLRQRLRAVLRWVPTIPAALLAAAIGVPAANAQTVVPAIAGEVDGLWYWELPQTTNGLRPTQSWSGAASSPTGDIYVAGMDHQTNSALYRLRLNTLSYLGDARAASTAAGNWLTNETAEKFHTHPTWLNGNVYVATLPDSNLNASYLAKRGFHWYRYTAASATFTDLSAGIGSGVAIAHGGPVSIAADPARNIIYAAINPTGQIVRFNVANRSNMVLGRPVYGRQYVYPGRWMWVDRKGRLYFTAGNSQSAYYGGEYDPAIFNHVYFYDPASGFGQRIGWKLNDQRAIDAGQCFPSAGVCILCDNVGHIYRFNEVGPTWSYLGNIGQSDQFKYGYVWVFHVRADRTRAYLISTNGDFFEFNLIAKTSRWIGNVKSVAPRLQQLKFLYGHNAWDKQGRFFFAAFSDQVKTGPNVLLTAIDPDRLKATFGTGQ